MQVYEVTVGNNGDICWRQNGKFHRLDGPAIERVDGDKSWYQNDKLHRLDGPAVEHPNGYKAWFVKGMLHRLDGPAIIHVDGTKEYWVDGVNLTEQQFNWKSSIKKMTLGQIEEALGHRVEIVKS